MINFYTTKNNEFTVLTEPEDGCWISMINPDESEIIFISEKYAIDPDAIRAALDLDERSHIESDENYMMLLVNIPTVEDKNYNELYTTIPLSIVVTREVIITVCSEDTPILRPFATNRVRDFRSNMKSRFILQILYRIAQAYLNYLRIIDRKTDAIENKLHKSTKNSELFELLKLERSLLYFTTSIRSNEAVFEKLFNKNELVKKYPEDDDLLEDVIIENKQAMEMASIYSGVLTGMMDAFGSVISNNLNIVMKLLAVITIVLNIPALIFNAYGMNLAAQSMPFAASPNGFLILNLIAVGLTAIATFIMLKVKLFK